MGKGDSWVARVHCQVELFPLRPWPVPVGNVATNLGALTRPVDLEPASYRCRLLRRCTRA